MNSYRINEGEFILENYDREAPFSSFLPGLTGEDGIPMWAFYTNRGQAIGSLGINSKSEAIIEFTPACTEYENTALKGFRTFIRHDGQVYEPFRYRGKAVRTMTVRKNSLRIEEVSEEHGFKLSVDYYILPKEPIGALVRRVKLTNISGTAKKAEVLDGASRIIPRGISNGQFEEMGNLFKSWTSVLNIEANAPIFAMRASTEDSAQVDEIKGGYFYACSYDGKLAPFICDTEDVFGSDTSLCWPENFEAKSLADIPVCREVVNKIPCAFTPIEAEIAPGAVISWTSYLGYAPSAGTLNRLLATYLDPGFSGLKLGLANEIAEYLTADVRTETGLPAFDKYIEQCYLDNFLRGGYPVTVGDAVLYLYSRKHGDPERDYNYFTIDGEYYSQGNGNFRDVCQNRRNDVFFCPEMKDYNIRCFASLIQADGYNPLEIRPATFSVKEGRKDEALALLESAIPGGDASVLDRRFKPGELFKAASAAGTELKMNPKEFVEKLLPLCDEHIEAGALEGYWSDHWDYIMDLVDDYLEIYPDRVDELLAAGGYRFYDSEMQVRPRSETYVLDNGKVWQYESMERSSKKLSEEGFNAGATNWKRNADGSIAEVSLFAKLFILQVTKFTLLDSYGLGIEMEGGKPGWNDAMNGLPAMFAGSMPETFELIRLTRFLLENVPGGDTDVPAEFAGFFRTVDGLLGKFPKPVAASAEADGNEGNADFEYWDGTASAREEYRSLVYRPLSGKTEKISSAAAKEYLAAALARLEAGADKAKEIYGGAVPTYFTYEPTAWDLTGSTDGRGRKNVRVKGFRVKTVPAFLEGPARYLAKGASDAKQVHERVNASGLYDDKLGMYKTSESIEDLSLQYGRIRAFTPGWLERESIFLHMEYKYLYALLVNGLYEEFYKAIETAFVPFMDPGVYGRSILENSSFIASSANPDPRVHGRGYVARLSGSTTEVLSMWIRMFIGSRSFYTENGELKISFEPKLAARFFGKEKTAAWTFMGRCRVVYHNPSGAATYGEGAPVIRSMKLLTTLGDIIEVQGRTLSGEYANRLRDGEIVRIDAFME